MSACADLGAASYLERSRSGAGGHVWMFFERAVKAADARAFGTRALTLAMERYRTLPFSAYDRLFPNQDALPEGGFGNVIALPLQGRAYAQGNSVFIDEHGKPYEDQWRFLSSVRKVPASLVEGAADGKKGAELGDLLPASGEDAPWKPRAKAEQPSMPGAGVRVVAANLIYVEKAGLDLPTVNAIRRLAAFANPAYYVAASMRRSLAGIPRIIYAGEDSERYIGLPRACDEALARLLEGAGASMRLEDEREKGRPIRAEFTGELRSEQREAAEALLAHDNGILEAATGFGKTVVGVYLIARLKVNALVLVPSTALLDQWVARLGQFLQIDEEPPVRYTKTGRVSKRKLSVVGRIGGGKDLASGIVDVAIAGSLFEKGDVAGGRRVKGMVREYGLVICDECHHVPAAQYERVVREVCARRVYGLTATPMRKDRLDPIMLMQCGPVRHRFGGLEQAEAQGFKRMLVPRFTRFRPPEDEEGRQPQAFNALLEAACADGERTALISDDAARLAAEGRSPLVLTRRVAHAKALCEKIAERGADTLLLVGSDDVAEKAAKLDALRERPSDQPIAVVATGDYVGEGFDDARFDALLLAAPVAWKGLVAQYAGRLHREREGKDEVRVYDYVDARVPMFDAMYRTRLKEYAALGYEVHMREGEGGGVGAGGEAAFFDDASCRETFLNDVVGAGRELVVACPYLHPKRVAQLREALDAAIGRGVRMTVRTEHVREESRHANAHEEAVCLLRELGAEVEERDGKQPSLAVVDRCVVWYGEVNLLAFPTRAQREGARSLRFESRVIADELFEADGL